nr:TRAP transporter small permease [Paracoccus sp. (in: a-proteobacteria)]
QMVKRAAWRPDGSFRLETSGSAWNPPYPGILKILLMIALAVMAVQFVILAVNYARARR